MEKGIDESRRHAEEMRKLTLEQVVVMLILARGKLKVLFDLEKVFLITQALFLLFPKLVKTVVVSIIINKFVLSLTDGLADLLADFHKLLARTNNSRLDKLELRQKGLAHFFHQRLVDSDVLHGGLCLWMFGSEIILGSHWGEKGRKRSRETRTGSQEI